VTYREPQWLADIRATTETMHSHLRRGDLSDGLLFGSILIRLLESREGVKALPANCTVPNLPSRWPQIARMCDHPGRRPPLYAAKGQAIPDPASLSP
jgi:hypothetical protein